MIQNTHELNKLNISIELSVGLKQKTQIRFYFLT